MELENNVIQWLMIGDPAIRWQTLRDLLDAEERIIEQERKLVAKKGWGAKLLSYQEPSGQWGGGLYTPKWISTTYTMLLLRRLGLAPKHTQALKACELLLNKGLYKNGGISYFSSLRHSETCVTGIILSILSYFQFFDKRVDVLAEYLLEQQMKDGGWNCQSYQGAIHSSFHTTILVLEGLREYEKNITRNYHELRIAKERAIEFLLVHRLYKSDKTLEIVNPAFTRFSFPPRWHYDILQVLDYFQESKAAKDERLIDAIEIVKIRRKKCGRWILQNRYPGRTFFEFEQIGQASRWNTLRALRVLKWWGNN